MMIDDRPATDGFARPYRGRISLGYTPEETLSPLLRSLHEHAGGNFLDPRRVTWSVARPRGREFSLRFGGFTLPSAPGSRRGSDNSTATDLGTVLEMVVLPELRSRPLQTRVSVLAPGGDPDRDRPETEESSFDAGDILQVVFNCRGRVWGVLTMAWGGLSHTTARRWVSPISWRRHRTARRVLGEVRGAFECSDPA